MAATTSNHCIRVGGDAVVVSADPIRLAQVLDTLLDNAIRYSPNGGDIDVSVTAREGEAIVCVRDRGVGIPQQKQERIFERFYRAAPHSSSVPKLFALPLQP